MSIAYWALREGTPFLHMPWFRMSHVQLEWQIPEIRRWYEALAGRMRLVRYDGRGIGLSQRSYCQHTSSATRPASLASGNTSATTRCDGTTIPTIR